MDCVSMRCASWVGDPANWRTFKLPSVAAPATLDHPQKTFVTIWFQDRTTSTATPIRCATSRDRGSSDVLVVDAESALVVTTALCDWD